VAGSPITSLVPEADAALAVVALYLGLEMLTHLDGDRAPAMRLFDQASALVAILGSPMVTTPSKETS
jgi:hypothetical protein